MKQKKSLIIIFVVCVVILIALGLSRLIRNDNNIIDNQNNKISVVIENGVTKMKVSQKIGNLEFSNVEIEKVSNGRSEFRADVYNSGSESEESKIIIVTVSNKDNSIYEVFGVQMSSIAPNGKITMAGILKKDITGSTNVKFEIDS